MSKYQSFKVENENQFEYDYSFQPNLSQDPRKNIKISDECIALTSDSLNFEDRNCINSLNYRLYELENVRSNIANMPSVNWKIQKADFKLINERLFAIENSYKELHNQMNLIQENNGDSNEIWDKGTLYKVEKELKYRINDVNSHIAGLMQENYSKNENQEISEENIEGVIQFLDAKMQENYVDFKELRSTGNIFIDLKAKINWFANSYSSIQKFNRELKDMLDTVRKEKSSLSQKAKHLQDQFKLKIKSKPYKRQKTSSSIDQSIFERNYIVSFKMNSKTIQLLDLDNLTHKNIDINISETAFCNISYCPISNNKIFCYGNHTQHNYSGITFIIDNSWNIEICSSGIPCTNSSLTYYKDFIFAFGGQNRHGDLDLAEKFSLFDREWIQCQPLPFPSHGCSCAPYKENIYITGFNLEKLYIYDPSKDLYSNNFLQFTSGVSKIILALRNSIIIVDSIGNFFSSVTGKEWTVGQVEGLPNIAPSSYKVLKGNEMYFSCGKQFFKFKMNSKKKIQQIYSII
ncbi:unnamed protein product [Blepharisma stoltei]|uniref:Kelch motif family protein n=1 Tax=Blepharisma stoltei TaxID=1481888 RepID=A0AAU9JPZ8_9CILI|nr:unnamed protein product [Blepharisma stoltei]